MYNVLIKHTSIQKFGLWLFESIKCTKSSIKDV